MTSNASQQDEGNRLRRQRNLFAVCAVLLIVVAIGATFPRRLRNYRDAKKANEELLAVQGEVVGKQNQIREVEAQIVQAQNEIKALQKR